MDTKIDYPHLKLFPLFYISLPFNFHLIYLSQIDFDYFWNILNNLINFFRIYIAGRQVDSEWKTPIWVTHKMVSPGMYQFLRDMTVFHVMNDSRMSSKSVKTDGRH